MDEKWKEVPGFGGHYEASNLGRVGTELDLLAATHRGVEQVLKRRVVRA